MTMDRPLKAPETVNLKTTLSPRKNQVTNLGRFDTKSSEGVRSKSELPFLSPKSVLHTKKTLMQQMIFNDMVNEFSEPKPNIVEMSVKDSLVKAIDNASMDKEWIQMNDVNGRGAQIFQR